MSQLRAGVLGIATAAVVAGIAATTAFAAPAPPNTFITSGPRGLVASTTASFAFRADQPATFTCSLDGSTWTACASPKSYTGLAQGAHHFAVRATGKKATDPSPATADWTVDTVAPATPTIDSAPATPSTSATASVAFSDAEAGVTFLCAIDGGSVQACQSPKSYSALPDGTHTVSVSARDAAGNTSAAATTSWTVDTAPPPVPSITAAPATATASTDATFAFSDGESGATFLCSLDGAPTQPCSSPASYSGLSVGSHAFSVQAMDAAGNTSASTGSIWAVQTEYVKNGSFEGSLSGWAADGGTLSLASDGVVGANAAKVNASTTGWVSVYPSPRPVSSTVAGNVFHASAWVRSDTPNTVCLRIREYDSTGSTLLNTLATCLTSSATWQRFQPLSYTPVTSGHVMTAFVYEPNAAAGDSFEADGVSLIGGLPATLPAQGDPVLAAGGDIACAPSSGYYNKGLGTGTACMQGATAALLGDIPSLQAVLPLGDEQYECGELANFQSAYEGSWGRFKAISHPVPGNHEYGINAPCTANTTAPGYFGYFGSLAGDPAKGYYSYDVAGWHVIALNSNCTVVGGCGAGSAEETWLRNDLALHPAQCTLAYWHHPRWSVGQIGDEPEYDAFWQDLYAAHVDLVLNGHDHTYQRFAALAPSGAADASGIREVIVGTGGEELMSQLGTRATLQAGDNTTFGVLQLVLHPSGYDAAFIPGDGGSFSDSFSGACH